MKKKIGRKVYNTEKSKYVGTNVEGEFGNPYGIEEQMYKKGHGDFFLVVSGGAESQYPEADILPLSLDDAKEWIVRVAGEEVLEEFVGEKDEEAAKPKPKKTPAKKTAAKKTTKKTDKK